MTLVLTIANVDRLENGEPTQLKLDRHGAVIGRSPHADWSLPDPNNYVSSTHCEIDYRGGGYLLIDKSTNGTFVNGDERRMSGAHALKDGDVIAIGHYRVSVSGAGAGSGATAGRAAPPPAASGPIAGSAGWGGWSADAAAVAPIPKPAAAPGAGWDAPGAGWAAAPPAAPNSAWGDAAPPAPAPEAQGWASPEAKGASQGWGSSTPQASAGWAQSDVASSSGWDAPRPPGPSAPGSSAPGPSGPSLSGPSPLGPSASAPGPHVFAPPPAPSSSPRESAGSGWDAPAPDASVWGAAGAGPAQPKASGWDVIAPARGGNAPAAGDLPGAGPPISGRGALSQNWSPPRIDTPSAPASSSGGDVWAAMAASNSVDWSRGGFGAPAAEVAPAAPVAATSGDVWPSFVRTLGIAPESLKAEPAQAAAAAGALLKALIAGLVVMMEARARAKAQLGAQSTTLELKGNNPIKFARSPERVLAQLLNPPERGFMDSADAVEDSFRDLQAHQMATLAAMQGALRATLDRFSPDAIRKRAEMRGILARILPGARNATLWEAYEREFEGVAKSSDEAFMDVFAKAFKQAYEEASAQMKSQAR